ncbi:hypothetical protein L596_015296 [Steinernema carpocapsae]|uniref:C-type lectin domain-containing protein n=1 Tax=Steinernema carpocapsae TaxID=34508 RepID=A0A4U5NES4_STECR|nr:hypothetical protein L596_015296 [Steinernema carpocapsae]
MRPLLAFAFLAFASTTFAFRPCPAGGLFSSGRSKCFHIIPVALSIRNAKQTCANFGANPASVTNERDNEMVQESAAFLRQNLHLKQKRFWLGGNDLDDTWNWDDESPFSYTNWQTGEPNNKTGNNCLQIDSVSGRWYSAKCNDPFLYVCETEPVNRCADPEGWRSFEDYLYKFYTEDKKNWTDAEDWCKKRGGNLASVHSSDEADFVAKLMEPSTEEAWIGGHRIGNSDQFDWTDGSAWDFSKWKWDPLSGFKCVSVSKIEGSSYTQGWTAGICEHPMFFVCKKPLDDYVLMKQNKDAFFRMVYSHYF